MRILAFSTLREFFEKHRDAEQQLRAWYHSAEAADWKSPEDIKRQYATASILGDNRVVFNIKGNKYRLVVKFNYGYHRGWIRFIGTHEEYDDIDAESI